MKKLRLECLIWNDAYISKQRNVKKQIFKSLLVEILIENINSFSNNYVLKANNLIQQLNAHTLSIVRYNVKCLCSHIWARDLSKLFKEISAHLGQFFQ